MNICIYKKNWLILQRILVILVVMVLGLHGCKPNPKTTKHVSNSVEVDSAMVAQIRFNMHMAEIADQACIAAVKKEPRDYVMDEVGFWYAKTISKGGNNLLQQGQEIILHIQIYQTDGAPLLDKKFNTTVGTDELPLAISRSLNRMRMGEQMQVITPWYAAYGIEGTNIIKPYNNLQITITTEE